jgi:NAD(P)-dependent dehydrogenase (short-subunit alcohol dehydrogenase family)
MAQHPALTEGRVAVITGAASGIGLAAAKRFAAMGLRVCLADLGGGALEQAAAEVALVARGGPADVLAVPTDVSKLEEVQRLKDRVYDTFGEVAVLMNNAGTSPGAGPLEHFERWQRVLNVNLWGVINGVQADGLGPRAGSGIQGGRRPSRRGAGGLLGEHSSARRRAARSHARGRSA